MEDRKMEDINKHIDPSMTGKVIFYWALACVPLGWGSLANGNESHGYVCVS